MRRRSWRAIAVLGAAALLLTACPADEVAPPPTDDAPVDDDAPPPDGSPGLEDCDVNPNTCNAGPRAEGGEIVWIVNALPGAWMALSSEGGSVYTLQGIVHGLLPYTGHWIPDGTYEFNLDLLAAEPELLGEDPFSWQFQIREEAVWNDGTPIGAHDFVALWKLSASDEEGHCVGCRSRAPSSFDRIATIEGSDGGKTVTITLKEGEADPEWFGWGSSHSIAGGLVPAHIAAENGFDLDVPEQVGGYFEFLNDNMPTFSGGPYQIVSGDLETQIIKEPNPNWYGAVAPTLDPLIMRFIDEESAWIPALGNREVHGSSPAATFDEDIIRGIQGLDNVYVHIGPGPSWEHIDFNMENEWLQDVELRRAIFTAIDVDDIGQRTYGGVFADVEPKTNHVFAADSPYHVDHITPTGQGSGDADAALEILTAAGYEFDGTTLTLDGETVGPFRLRATATSVRVTSMELIQSYLAEIGIEIVIETTANLGETLGGQDYDIIQFGWSGSPFFVNTPAQQWLSTSGSNFGKYNNPEVDELVEQVLAQPSLDAAADLTNQAIAILVSEAYVLPLVETPVYMFVTDEYANIRENSNHSLRSVFNHHEWGLLAQ